MDQVVSKAPSTFKLPAPDALKTQWTTLYHQGLGNMLQGHKTKQMIGLGNILLNFSETANSILIFDFTKKEWESVVPTGTPLLIKSQYRHPIFILEFDSIAIFGGKPNTNANRLEKLTVTKDIQGRYMLSWGIFEITNSLPFRKNHSAEYFNGLMYIFGGQDSNSSLCSDLFILNLRSMSSYQNIITTGLSPGRRYDHSSLLHNEKMYIFGGVGDTRQYLHDVWVWNLKLSSGWERLVPKSGSTMGVLPAPRSLALVQRFKDSIFLLKGGTKDGICEDLLWYKSSGQWEDLSLKHKLPFSGEAHLFRVYTEQTTTKLLIGQNLNLYEVKLNSLSQDIEPIDEASKLKQLTKITEDFESFRSYFKRMYKERLFPDIVFKVEGEEVPAHKGVLAGRAKYFENMFSSGMAESQKQVIDVPNVKAEVFKALLEYLYCDETEIKIETALDLLRLADEYSIEELKEKCGDFLEEKLQIDSIIEVANTASSCEVNYLKEAAIEFIIENIYEINEKHDITKLHKTLLFELIVKNR